MPRELRWHGLFNSIAIVILLTTCLGISGCAQTIGPERPIATAGGVRFTVSAPGVKSVCVVGAFNGWVKNASPMAIAGGDVWSVVVPLREGEYPFMYVFDEEQWVTPPHADDFVTDGFGQTNGVVVVR